MRELERGKFQASTRLRKFNGATVRVRAIGSSRSAASNNLKTRCTALLGVQNAAQLSTTSTIASLVDAWLEESKDHLSTTSMDRYQTSIDNHIKPGLGQLRLNEVGPTILDPWLHAQSPGVALMARKVLQGSFRMALRLGTIGLDPMVGVRPIKTAGNQATPLDVDEIPRFRALIRSSGNEVLRDIVDVALSTGLRPGELFALRWQDIHLGAKTPYLSVTGTLVNVKGQGIERRDEGKTKNAHRNIALTDVAVDAFKRRKIAAIPGQEMVFMSASGTWFFTSSVNTWIRKAVGDSFPNVSMKTFRQTVATIVRSELGSEAAADVLGHSDSRITERYYVGVSKVGVPVGDTLDGVLKVSIKSEEFSASVGTDRTA